MPIDLSRGPWFEAYDSPSAGYPRTRDTDFDRDGVADLMGRLEGRFAIASWDGRRLVATSSNVTWPETTHVVEAMDFDADGDTDLLVRDSGVLSLVRNCTEREGRRDGSRPPLRFCDSRSVARIGNTETVLRVADFDGDGLPDLYVDWSGAGPPTAARILFSRRVDNGFLLRSASIESLGGPAGSLVEREGTGFFDANGDGLLDIYQVPDGLWLNTGGRFTRVDPVGSIAVRHHLRDAVFAMDLDGDGRDALLVPADLVHPWCFQPTDQAEPREYCGEDFGRSGALRHQDRSIYRWDAVTLRFGPGRALTFQRTRTDLVAPVRAAWVEDFHGDGLADVRYRLADVFAAGPVGTVRVGTYHSESLQGNFVARNLGGSDPEAEHDEGQVPDLLLSVRDGLGREHTWQHAPLSSAGVAECPAPAESPFYRVHRESAAPHHYHFTSSMQVVARFTAPDGAGGQMATCYRYEDAMYSDEGRGFQGFRAIVAEEALGDGHDLRTTTRYHDAFPLTGRPQLVQVHLAREPPDHAPLRETAMTWEATCERGICFPYLRQQIDRVRDLHSRASLHTTTTRYLYRAEDRRHGNPSTISVTIEDASQTRRQRTEFTYDYRDADAWWLDKRIRQIVVHAPVAYRQRPLPELEDNLQRRVVTLFRWHAETSPARRLLARVIVQPDHDSQEQQTTYAYDDHGNLVREGITAAGLGPARERRWAHTPDGYFTAAETNPAGHITSFVHDPATGLVREQTHLGLTTTYDHDGFGRLRTRHAAGEPPVHLRLLRCNAACPPAAVLRQVTVQDGAPVVEEHIDAHGRILRREWTGFGGRANQVQVAEYDARGRLVRYSAPGAVGERAHFTEFHDHDALGRPGRRVEDRTGYAHDTVTTAYRYAGPTTHITRSGDVRESRTVDAWGQLVETVDATGTATHYRHDGPGNLILVENGAGHRITARHDSRGRRLRLTDPDSGTWHFEYNGLGEITRQTDARGHNIGFHYDRLGRLVARDVNGVPEAEWHYDRIRPGVLDAVHGSEGSGRTYRYDDLLRPVQVVTQVGDLRRFTQEYAYDGYYGRTKAMRAPDGEVLAFDHDAHGYPVAERDPSGDGFVYRRIEAMTPRGQIARERFGNGLLGHYDHVASTGELTRIRVLPAGAGALPVQDLAYAYDDPHGNLTRREDRVLGTDETFTFDALQRLTAATRSWQDGRPPVTVGYAYDALGNLVRKDDFAVRYEYGDPTRQNPAHAGPHAVLAVELPNGRVLRDFAYDASGNLVTSNGRTLRHDALGQVVEIEEAGEITHFAYAPDGTRFRQERPGHTTYYVGAEFEYVVDRTGPEPTIATRTYLDDYLVIEHAQGQRRLRYLHPDRLGSLATITDQSGEPIARHAFAPFGRPLAADGTDTGGRLHDGEVATATTPRGFTGHEHLDAHRLIHMGGRLFDPGLGRFLSVDPFIQNLASSQSLNPYSYVLNNPFAATDPTGYARACLPKGGEGVPACGGPEEPLPNEPTAPDTGGNGREGQTSRGQNPRPPVENQGPASRDDGTGGPGRAAWPAGGSLRHLATGDRPGTDSDRSGMPHRASAPEPLSMLPLGAWSSENHAPSAAAGVIVRVLIKIASKGRKGVQRVFRRRPASRPGSTTVPARGASNLVKVGEWTLDPRVSRHLMDVSKSGELVRPYLKSPHTLREIMAAGRPGADPRGFPGAVRYDVPGAFRGSQGTWELVVHPESKTVLHWLFRSGP